MEDAKPIIIVKVIMSWLDISWV